MASIVQESYELGTLKELLKETEQMLNFGTWSVDISSGKWEWSDGMYRLLGYAKQDLDGELTEDFYISHIDEKQRQQFSDHLKKSIADRTAFSHTYGLKAFHKDEIMVHTKGKVLLNDKGEATRLIGVTSDITRMRDYEQSLEDKVKELDRSNKELEEFAYIASHDLQEPVRKITSFSERLREKLGDDIGSESLVYLNRMLAATGNMRSLIDNLLEFSRISRYNQPFEKIDLNEILTEVNSDLELKIEETRTVIHQESLPSLEAIPSQMRQLFTNLLTNAIKFTRPGTAARIDITARVASKEEKEEYHLRNNKTWHRISVKDSGIGFEQQYAAKIFQIFQRLHGKAEYPGTGIGLAICKKIAENHKGIILAKGEPDQGAEFIIILPETQI